MAKKSCPRCAERVRIEARICRFCGHEFQKSADVVQQPQVFRHWGMLSLVVSALLVAAGLSYGVYRELRSVRHSENTHSTKPGSDQAAPKPNYENLAAGDTLEWSADDMPDLIQRQVGPYVVTITKRRDDDFVAPIVKVSAGAQSVQIEGQALSSGYTHRISAVQNLRSAPPIVMIQSFTGGAHCCNVVTLAGYSHGKLKVIELGMWDGDQIELPKDISGDGVADFVMRDGSFLYAFSSYASSYSPPKILNVVSGKVADVSRRPAFRKLFADAANEAREVCRYAESSDQRNGACPTYVAAAARIGKLQEAWSNMLTSYDAKSGWDFPSGCRVKKDNCPPGLEIKFKSYPESLLYFLKEKGYVAPNWLPPEAYDLSNPGTDNRSDDWTA